MNKPHTITPAQEAEEAMRLPLWKNVYEQMIAEGCNYGATYPAEFFERGLKAHRDSMRFSLDLARIRRALEHHGFYLSGLGGKGAQWVIVAPESNADKLLGYQREAMDALRRGVILGTNTRLDTLTAEQRRKHEATLEKLATRSALISRGTVARTLNFARKSRAKIERT